MRLCLVTVLIFSLLAVSAEARSKVSATLPAQAPQSSSLLVTGQVSGVKRAVAVRVEQQNGKKWQKLASGRSDKKGKFSLTITLPAAATVKLRVAAKVARKTVTSKPVQITLTANNNSGGGNSGGTQGPLFTPPGRDLSGNEAAQAILPYLTNSTFTDCVAGWPNCAVESRYGYFADGNSYYCRLTNNSGSDIINGAHPYRIIGAEMKADGSWSVDLEITSYENKLTYYEWRVATSGLANGAYWGPDNSIYANPSNPTDLIGPLQWVRGARNCSY